MIDNKIIQFIRLIKKSGNLLEGYNRCEEALKNNKAQLIIISEDVSENTKRKFTNYCNRYEVEYINKFSKYDLGEIVNKDFVSIIGITNKSMAENLYKLISNQNSIN